MGGDQMQVSAATPVRPPAARGTAVRTVAPELVGRAAELERLVSVVAAPPAVAMVEGEAGIGKTRLVTELARHRDVVGRRFLVGGCRRIREPFPLGPVIEAVRQVGENLAEADLSPVAGTLQPLLPELADWLPPQPPPLDDRAGDRHRVFRGLVEILASVGPSVLVLEDLHWADDQTAEFLAHLLGDPPPRLAVVLTFRGEEVDPAVRASTTRLPGSVGCADVSLSPFDAQQTGKLADAILDIDHVSDEFAEHLRQRTGGLPFAIEEVLALLRERRDLVRDGGGWARPALSELDVPAGIRDSVLERASRLSDDARTVINMAATLQAPVPLEVLMSACASRQLDPQAGAEQALVSGLLVERGDTIGFRHEMAAEAVYKALPGPRRAKLHALAASALGQLDPPPLGQLAHHFKHAGQVDQWVAAAERAAAQATSSGHEDEAVRLLMDLLRHGGLDTSLRHRLAVKLGEVSVEIRRDLTDVIALLEDELDHAPPPAVRGELTFWLAMIVETAAGDWALRRRLYVEAARNLGHRPDLYARAMTGLGIPLAPGIPVVEHVRYLREALSVLPKVDDALVDVFVRGKVAMVFAAVGDPEWREIAEEIVDQTGGCPHDRQGVNAYGSIGEMACYAGYYGVADRLLTAAHDGAALCESERLALRVSSDRALLDYFRGAWDGLDDTAETLVDELAREPLTRINAQMAAGCLALAHGDVDSAKQWLWEVAEQAEALGWLDAFALATSVLARHAITTDDVEEVGARLAMLFSAMDAKGLWAPLARALPAMVQTLIAAEREPEAHALVARAERELADVDAPLAPAALEHAHGILRTSAEQWAAAAAHFLAAAESYEALHCPYEAAQSREQAALSLAAAGGAQADAVFSAALAAYRGLGATWDVARCAQAARTHGIRVPTPHRGGRRGYGDALSPREREVAELAATGRTNKEIADELFLAVSTVEKHMTRAMRKLDVRSRTAVAACLDDTSPDQQGQ